MSPSSWSGHPCGPHPAGLRRRCHLHAPHTAHAPAAALHRTPAGRPRTWPQRLRPRKPQLTQQEPFARIQPRDFGLRVVGMIDVHCVPVFRPAAPSRIHCRRRLPHGVPARWAPMLVPGMRPGPGETLARSWRSRLSPRFRTGYTASRPPPALPVSPRNTPPPMRPWTRRSVAGLHMRRVLLKTSSATVSKRTASRVIFQFPGSWGMMLLTGCGHAKR